MFAAIKSELRKILTVRSTYIIIGAALLLVGFFAFYATGYRASDTALFNPELLKAQVQQAVIATGILGSLVGVLLVTHEYRYNTIMYTLTATASRTKVFVAKLLAIALFSVVFAFVMGVASPLLTVAGIAASGRELAPQTMSLGSIFWTTLFVGWAYSMLSFIFAMIVRVQVGAISIIFLVPAMVEPLLGLLLRKDAIYLPYNALQSVLQQAPGGLNTISTLTSVSVVMLYIAGGWLLAWQLFLHRDAQ